MIRVIKPFMKTLLIIIGIIVFIIYACPLIAGILNAGNLFGMGVGAIFILIGIIYNRLTEYISVHNAVKPVLIAVLIAALAFAVVFFATLSGIVSSSKYSAENQTTVVVLGCRVRGDVPSLQLSKRCSEAAKYLNEHPDAVAILAGGQGPDENISEAECMYNLITKEGIESSRLYIENSSTSTDENIKFSKQIIDKNRLSTDIVVVSSEYHLKRAEMICEKNGLKAASIPAKSSFYSLPTFYTREVFGVWAQWLEV